MNDCSIISVAGNYFLPFQRVRYINKFIPELKFGNYTLYGINVSERGAIELSKHHGGAFYNIHTDTALENLLSEQNCDSSSVIKFLEAHGIKVQALIQK